MPPGGSEPLGGASSRQGGWLIDSETVWREAVDLGQPISYVIPFHSTSCTILYHIMSCRTYNPLCHAR